MHQRVMWRSVVRTREDRAHNERLAERLLVDEATDDYVIAFGVLGWRLSGPNAERWPMIARTVLVPSWCISIAEQDRDARRGAAVVAEIDKHRPKPRAELKDALHR
jgi:hypothetical protein